MIWDVAGIVVLTLLKILGIILLILLALFLLVLLVPIRYQVGAAFDQRENGSGEYEVRGSVSWLGFLIRFPFLWKDGQLQWRFQILGIPFLKNAMSITVIKGAKSGDHTRDQGSGGKRKKGRNRRKAEKQAVSSEENSEESKNVKQESDLPQENKDHKEAEEETVSSRKSCYEKVSENNDLTRKSGDTDAEQGEKTEDTVSAAYKQPEDAQNKKKHKKQSLFQRLWQKIRELYETICDITKTIREKIHSVQDLMQLLQQDSSKRFICTAKENMLQLWRHLKPQKIKGDIRFGTGDPCTTGQILGGIAVVYSWIGTGVHITPDFEEACFVGKIAVKGRIRIITMIVIMVRLIISKDFRTLIRELKQWKEDL